MSFSAPALLDRSFLAVHGSTLVRLLHRAKSIEGLVSVTNSIYDEIEEVIKQLLKDLSEVRGLFIEESLTSVMTKVEDTLQEFIILDTANASRYKELAEQVRGFKSRRHTRVGQQQQHIVQGYPSFDQVRCLQADSPDSERIYQRLNSDERRQRQLVWFSLLTDGRGINKRELMYWWIGMDLIHPDSDGGKQECEEILEQLQADDFIERAIANKKAFNFYRMKSKVRSAVIQQAVGESWCNKVTPMGSFSIIYTTNGPEQIQIEALLNISQKSFSAATGTFEWFSKMKKAKVVHLGAWGTTTSTTDTKITTGSAENDGDDDSYIVVQDEARLGKALKHLGQVRCLSLQGISGIVKLPDSVCKLENLRVLDLRACNNLELLPKEIGSLQQLTHLDLSKCYLLDHFPIGVAALSELRVLKGFIINPDRDRDCSQEAINNHDDNNVLGVVQKNQASSCTFSDLSKLKKLTVLTVRTRRMNFPTSQDFQTMRGLPLLTSLRIAWVGSSSHANQTDHIYSQSDRFPESLRKLEFQAPPNKTAARLLGLIRGGAVNCPEKLYIRGGELVDLGPKQDCSCRVNVVSLRHLPKLRLFWTVCNRFLSCHDCRLSDVPNS